MRVLKLGPLAEYFSLDAVPQVFAGGGVVKLHLVASSAFVRISGDSLDGVVDLVVPVDGDVQLEFVPRGLMTVEVVSSGDHPVMCRNLCPQPDRMVVERKPKLTQLHPEIISKQMVSPADQALKQATTRVERMLNALAAREQMLERRLARERATEEPVPEVIQPVEADEQLEVEPSV